MDKAMVNFLKKYKIHILVSLLIIMFARGCSKSKHVSKLEKSEKANIEMIDSLKSLVNAKNSKLDSIPELMRIEKLSIYLSLDDTISRVDRTPQLMGFHALIKDRIKELQK